jgi:hypothetical protein
VTQIAWTDLNNVREAGEFPFWDGRITISFAEIAIWKTNPHAKFRLMHKYPIQAEPQYVLGEQVEDRGLVEEKIFYTSSNGDWWSLIRDQTTDVVAIKHVANPSSGGNATQIDIETFLSNGADGPEHQALKRLVEKSSNATILIAYDIHPAEGAAYDDLIGAIQSLGAWWHHLETVWIVRSNQKPDEIRDKLRSHIGTDDQLLILDITGDRAGWAGVSDAGSEWLKEYTVDGSYVPLDQLVLR